VEGVSVDAIVAESSKSLQGLHKTSAPRRAAAGLSRAPGMFYAELERDSAHHVEGGLEIMPDEQITMDVESAKGIFTRMYQSLDMLRLIDQNKNNSQISVADLYQEFLCQYPEDPHEHFFFNHQLFMGCLLAFIVIPQGIVDGMDETLLSELSEDWHLADVKISVVNNPEQVTLKMFMRKIRNSISHARFWATSETTLNLAFEDRFNDSSPVNFRAELPLNDLYGFCKRFNKWVIISGPKIQNSGI
jgi:hypothetical protein